MPKIKAKPVAEDPLELIGRAVAAYDVQIAELQAKRDLLAILAQPAQAAAVVVKTPAVAPPKQRTMSAEAKAKIGAATKKRWAARRKAEAAAQKESTAQAVPVKAKPKKKTATKKAKATKPVEQSS
jgi:hypothetical protein